MNSYYDGLSETEIEILKKVKSVGQEKGDSLELQKLYREAMSMHSKGLISKEAIDKIYATCMDYAYPR